MYITVHCVDNGKVLWKWFSCKHWWYSSRFFFFLHISHVLNYTTEQSLKWSPDRSRLHELERTSYKLKDVSKSTAKLFQRIPTRSFQSRCNIAPSNTFTTKTSWCIHPPWKKVICGPFLHFSLSPLVATFGHSDRWPRFFFHLPLALSAISTFLFVAPKDFCPNRSARRMQRIPIGHDYANLTETSICCWPIRKKVFVNDVQFEMKVVRATSYICSFTPEFHHS